MMSCIEQLWQWVLALQKQLNSSTIFTLVLSEDNGRFFIKNYAIASEQ